MTLRIIFLGTPDFAVATLDALMQNDFQVVAVVTSPDKPGGRGMKLQESAVKKYAVAHQLPVLQPEKLKDPAFIETLKSFKADLQIVVAFRMWPSVELTGSLVVKYAVWARSNISSTLSKPIPEMSKPLNEPPSAAR